MKDDELSYEERALEFWNEYVKLIRHYDDKNCGVNGVMIPSLTNKELREYCKERSGEVVKYKLGDDENYDKDKRR